MQATGAPRYAGIARVLHWTTAALVFLMVPVGFLLLELPAGPIQDTAFDLHRSTGVLLFALTVIRLGYRLGHPAPPLPDELAAVQKFAAGATHVMLYGLLLLQPLVGWWGPSAYGAPIRGFWLFPRPPLVAPDKALAEQVLALHGWLGLALVGVVAVHVGAALHHHFVRRDGILRRML
jgi:cytochrome b561